MKLKDWQIVQWKFYQAVNWAYWFLEVEWFEEHIFVFGWNKADALDQDIVEAKIKIFKWKFEAEIIRVIRRAERLLMWEFEKPKRINCWFVKPFNPAIKTDIFIPERFINNAKNKDIVVVRILRWDGKNPEWKIVEVLWDKTNPETIINWYILESWFKLKFPKKVLDEVKWLKNDAIWYFDKNKKNDDITEKIIWLAYKVQNELWYWLEEKVYQNALKILLEKNWFKVKKEVKVPLEIDWIKVWHWRIDLLVDDKVIIEIKKSFDRVSTAKQIKKYLSEERPIALAIYFSNEWVKVNRFEYEYYHKESLKNHKKSSFRKDLRNLFTFTIDWEDARDLDDAISIEKNKDWYKLYVHIADVAHYVKPWSVTQNEAYLRATSVYLPHKVLPMLPEKLSNDLCSLNPNTDKLTLTCEMNLDNNWNLKNAKVYESVINSNYRLTYKEVQQMYDKKIKEWDILLFSWKVTKQLLEKINIAYELKDKVSKNKEEQWVLWFDFPETKIIVDENLQVVDFKPYPIYESNKLIEEFMILANQSVSKKFSKIPFLYRIHEKPKAEDIERLKKILDIFWIHFTFVNYDTKEYAELIKEVQKHKERYILEKLILRTLQKAIYSDKNLWHFWLWLEYYSHFTSPIRRYPDYQIHRIIKQKLHWKLSWKTIQIYKSKLEQIAKHCSEQEIKAQKLEWKVKDFFMVQYYKDKVWQEFEWIISWMIPAGIFVALENTAEWFVQLIKKDEDLSEWEPDMEILQFKNTKTGQILSIWQTVKVKLTSVDENLLRLNFQLINEKWTNTNPENNK